MADGQLWAYRVAIALRTITPGAMTRFGLSHVAGR